MVECTCHEMDEEEVGYHTTISAFPSFDCVSFSDVLQQKHSTSVDSRTLLSLLHIFALHALNVVHRQQMMI